MKGMAHTNLYKLSITYKKCNDRCSWNSPGHVTSVHSLLIEWGEGGGGVVLKIPHRNFTGTIV